VPKADNLPLSCAVVTKSGSFNFLESSGPVQACNGTNLPLHRSYEVCCLNGSFVYHFFLYSLGSIFVSLCVYLYIWLYVLYVSV